MFYRSVTNEYPSPRTYYLFVPLSGVICYSSQINCLILKSDERGSWSEIKQSVRMKLNDFSHYLPLFHNMDANFEIKVPKQTFPM